MDKFKTPDLGNPTPHKPLHKPASFSRFFWISKPIHKGLIKCVGIPIGQVSARAGVQRALCLGFSA